MNEVIAAKLANALVDAQEEMPKVEPDAVNPHFKSKFVSLDHLIAKTRPVLNKHGLAIVQSPSHIDGQPALTTTIYHTSGEAVTSVMPLLLAGSDMQKLGAALTYARRYAWAAALGIAGEEDDDGNAASAPPKSAPKVAEKEKTGPPATDALMQKLIALSLEYKALVNDFDVSAVRLKAAERAGKADYKVWLEKQIVLMEGHIKEKTPAEGFPIPAKAKAAA